MNSGEELKKNANPRENANIINLSTFFYTFPLFFKGFKQEIEESDLCAPLKAHKSSRLGNKIEKAWQDEVESSAKQKKDPSLTWVLIKLFGFEYFKFGIIHIITDLFVKIAQCLFLAKLIDFYTPNQTVISQTEAYLYAGGVAGCSLLVVLLLHPTFMEELHIGMKIRVACCSLLYRKTLRLNTSAYQETTVGQIVNLLSNDVNRFDIIPAFLHFIWIGPLQTAVSLYFMYQSVGLSAVFGIIFILLFIPLEIYLAKLAAKLRLKTAIRTDERVRLMNEIITGIQVIKMYTWEKPYDKFVALARKLEIDVVLAGSYVKAIYSSFTMFTSRTALFVTLIIYVLPYNNIINAQQVFLLTAFYNIIRHSMTVLFPQGLAVVAETKISINRLTKFLMYGEQLPAKDRYTNGLNGTDDSITGGDNNIVVIENGNAKWMDTQKENLFNNLNVNIKRGQLIAIIGPVGSGKSSLFHVILNELPLLKGRVSVKGKISYASQEPWLFSNNVRQNILFGDEMNRHHYNTVVNRCALEEDFRLFPYGDKTMVGERGISLSGGQRARINLARAIYKEADIYLLDDPLSAVDTHVGKHIFEKCIKEYLHNKTVVLITHQLQFLKEVDRIIIVENGSIKAEGSYSELTSLGLDFTKLLKMENELNQEIEQTKRVSIVNKVEILRSTSVISETLDSVGPEAQTEQKSEGSISAYVYKRYIGAGGNCCVLFFIFSLLVFAQVVASLSDYFITFWVNLLQDRDAESVTKHGRFLPWTYNRNHSSPMSIEHKDYDPDSFWNISNETAIYIYSGLTILVIILSMTRTISFFKVAMSSSIKLHRQLFNSIIHSKMLFFNTNTSGRILNRFSKDMGNIDDRLPLVLVETLQILLNVIAVVIMVVIINYWLAIPSLVIIVVFYFLRIFFLRTSRAVKRLEGTTRSPVFGHLGASLEGLPTIRAFGSQNKLQKEFDDYQDVHSSCWFAFISSAMAFGYWLDLICVLYIAIVTLTFVLMDSSDEYGGNVGLAITQSLSLTGMFQWGMKQSTELENQMTSVERVLEYINNIEPEPALESSADKKPKPEWPEKGEIKFKNLSLKYSPNDPPVLRNLNFTIGSLEKIGIVGRTGAGKSSLIAALFRLADCEGIISIDDINTGEIGLHDLRSKISIIPQEPVLFSGTLRKNLDPFDRYSDEILWKALEEVELKKAVTDSHDGLDMPMVEGGKNFSLGQRQLVCLARAIIQNNRVLIMDEATANVDLQTDALIQSTIRRKFADCSVLTIAHRLNTVIDSDKVLVMNAGRMVEFDHPYILLQNNDSYFYKMVAETGKAMTNVLIEAAAKNYNSSKKLQSE